jgi:thiol-disulfide isomerase/thioredoxin
MKTFKVSYLKLPYLVFICATVLVSNAYAVQQPSHFKLGSYQKILQQNKQQSFLMVLWSLGCLPCIKELKMLGEFHQKYPQHKLVLISTDSKNQSAEIIQLITKYGLQTVDQWVFDGSFQYLRHSIDPAWYGELPRGYFFKRDQSRIASSGQLHQHQLVEYFSEDIKI